MATVRDDVAKLLETEMVIPTIPVEEEEEMTQEKFNEMMDNYLVELAKKEASPWSAEARAWCEANGIIKDTKYLTSRTLTEKGKLLLWLFRQFEFVDTVI